MDSSSHLSPALERLWIDEVRYLHGLWRVGPPRSHIPATPLAPVRSQPFKSEQPDRKKRRNNRKNKKNKLKLQKPQDQSQTDDWPCTAPNTEEVPWPYQAAPDPAPDEVRGWGENVPTTGPPEAPPIPLLKEEMEKIFVRKLQRDCIGACKEFFSATEDDDIDPMDINDEDETGVFEFFVNLFVKCEDLRCYYEKKWEKGEFLCLVCEGIGEKIGKRYGDCVGVVQHANNISKTKRKEGHRAFARAVCQVLGWNMERLPSIVLVSGAQLNHPGSDVTATQENLHIDDSLNDKEEHPEKSSEHISREYFEPAETDCEMSDAIKVKENFNIGGSLNDKEEQPEESSEQISRESFDPAETDCGMSDAIKIKENLHIDGSLNDKEEHPEESSEQISK